MATSAKSSVAALLLVVAVLAGSCASGANADYTVVNICKDNATLVSVGVPVANVVVAAGDIVTVVGQILHDVKIVIAGKTYVVLVADVQALLNLLNLNLNLTAVAKLEIACASGACGHNALTINVYAKVRLLNILKVQLVGHVCAKLKV